MNFSSTDTRFAIEISPELMQKMISICRDTDRLETGGILIGRYTRNYRCAEITDISAAPSDSTHTTTRFIRGIRGLQKWLFRIWSEDGTFYLGEWHFHPYAPPEPSTTDADAMRGVATSRSYDCPEPILLVIGGDPNRDLSIGAYVWTEETELQELIETRAER